MTYITLIALGVAILFVLITSAMVIIALSGGRGRRPKLVKRLQEIQRLEPLRLGALEKAKETNFVINALIVCGRLVAPENVVRFRVMEKRLQAAGFYSEDAVYVFLGFRVFLPVVLFLVSLIISLILSLLGFHLLIVIIPPILGIAIGLITPFVVLHLTAKRRKRMLLRGFPDALDLLAVCIEAGAGFDTAIKRVAEEMGPVNRHVSIELMSYIYETRIGVPRHEALRNLGERTGVDIIKSFTALLIQSDKLGTSIVDAMRVYSDSLRTKRRQDAETQAARLPVLMIFPLLFFIFPSLFVVILGPATINIHKNLVRTHAERK